MKDFKQLEDELLEEVNGGGTSAKEAQFFINYVLYDQRNLLGIDLKYNIMTIFSKLSKNEQINLLHVIETLISKDNPTKDKLLELQNELRRILSTINL